MRQLLTLLITGVTLFALDVGSPLPSVILQDDEGGRIDGTAFDSDILRDKVHVVFYVDPDEKDLNSALSDALKAEAFDRSKYGSVAIINMDATWLPNMAIESSLEKKQKKFLDTIYVKDLKKVLVKRWEIADDDSDIIILDKSGKVIYLHEGRLDETQIETAISLIKDNI